MSGDIRTKGQGVTVLVDLISVFVDSQGDSILTVASVLLVDIGTTHCKSPDLFYLLPVVLCSILEPRE